MNKKLILAIISAFLCINTSGCKTINISFDDTNSDETTSSSSSVSSVNTENNSTSSDSETSSNTSSDSDKSTQSNTASSTTNSNTNSPSSDAKTETPDVNVTINTEPKYIPVPVYPVIPQKVYYSDSYVFPKSSYEYLSKSQVVSLSNYELGIARNEIYARHGYIFDLAQFRNYFNSQTWYTPLGKNVTLNRFESYNVELIKSEENRRGIKW